MSKCVKCGKEFADFVELFGFKFNVCCRKCRVKYQPTLHEESFEGFKVTYLYEYHEELMSDLLSLKSMGKKEIADALIPLRIRLKLKRRFKNTTFLYMPSSKEDDEERGFRHVEVLFHDIVKESYYPLRKIKKYKQATSKLKERMKVKNYLAKEAYFELKDQKYVLVDDIISSGSTLRAAKEILGLNDGEILVLLWNHQSFGNETM